MKLHKWMFPLVIAIPKDYYQRCMEYKVEAPTLMLQIIRHGEPLENILDKIRAEIQEDIESLSMADWETNNILADGLQMALNIIDEYRNEVSE